MRFARLLTVDEQTSLNCLQPASQSANWGAETREAQVDVPRLFTIPAFDCIAGHCNRLPNSNGEYATANISKVRLRTMTNKTNYS